MKTCSISEAKQKLGRLADAALKGQPTVIVCGSQLVILQAYEFPDPSGEFDMLIQAGMESAHRQLTAKVFKSVWKKGRSLSRK